MTFQECMTEHKYHTAPVMRTVTSRHCRDTLFTVRLFTNKLLFFPGKLLVFSQPHNYNITSHSQLWHCKIDSQLTLTANCFIILVPLTRKTLCTGTWEVAHNTRYICDRLSNVTEIKTQMSGLTVAYVYMVINMYTVLVPCHTLLVRWKEAWCWYSSFDQFISRLWEKLTSCRAFCQPAKLIPASD